VQHEGDVAAPTLLLVGEATEAHGIETWLRWTLPADRMPELSSSHSVDEAFCGVADTRPPSIWVGDGTRMLALDPDKLHEREWNGVLFARDDNRLRMGPPNCGVLFGEQWLSDVLKQYSLAGYSEAQGNSNYQFARTASSVTDRLLLTADASGLPLKIEWFARDELRVATEVLSTCVVDDVAMIAAARVAYSSQSVIEVRLDYPKLAPERCPSSLLELPEWIAGVGGIAHATDENTGAQLELGAVDSPPWASSTTATASTQAWPWLVLAGFAGALALLGRLMWRGRGRGQERRSNRDVHLLCFGCLVIAMTMAVVLPPTSMRRAAIHSVAIPDEERSAALAAPEGTTHRETAAPATPLESSQAPSAPLVQANAPAQVVGRVVDEDDVAVAGVPLLVEVVGEAPWQQHVVSDQAGMFRVELPACTSGSTFTLSVQSSSLDPHLLGSEQLCVCSPGMIFRVWVLRFAGTVTVRGRLLSSEKDPVGGGLITASGTSIKTVSDDSGAYEITLPCSDGSLSITYQRDDVSVQARATIQCPDAVVSEIARSGHAVMDGVDLYLEPDATNVRLCIRDEAGRAIGTAQVRLGSNSPTIEVASDGCASVRLRASQRGSLQISAPGYCDAWLDPSTDLATSAELLVVLESPRQLSISVVDENMQAIPGCTVTAVGEWTLDDRELSGLTDSAGHWSLPLCEHEHSLSFRAVAPDGRIASRAMLVNPAKTEFVLQVREPELITGRVSDSDGMHVANARLVAYGDDQGDRIPYHATTSELGSYELRVASPGRYRITVHKLGMQRVEQLAQTGEQLDFVLEPSGVISGRLRELTFESHPSYAISVLVEREAGRLERIEGPIWFHGQREFTLPVPDVAIGSMCTVEFGDGTRTIGRAQARVSKQPSFDGEF
jgi:hypothetical protein